MGVLAAVAVGIGVAAVWFFLTRASRSATVSRAEFDDTYDEVAAGGRDREAAWRDFDTWQLANEQERLSWEEPTDE